MAIRPIVIHGNPVLHRPAAPVTEFNDELKELVADMYETMDASNGVGLAAPQIGVGLRIFTYKMENEDGVPPRGCIINPVLTLGKISTADPDPYEEEEGCLSFPGYGFPLKRAEWVTVNGLDEHGNPVHFEATGWFARCMQHETDHLDGKLYVNRLNKKWTSKMKKVVKKEGWTVDGNSCVRKCVRGLRLPSADGDVKTGHPMSRVLSKTLPEGAFRGNHLSRTYVAARLKQPTRIRTLRIRVRAHYPTMAYSV